MIEGPKFYITHAGGKVVHATRFIEAGQRVHLGSCCIICDTEQEIDEEVLAMGLVPFKKPWKDRIKDVWKSAPSEISQDPVISELASIVASLNDVVKARAVIATAKAANSENPQIVAIADSLLSAMAA